MEYTVRLNDTGGGNVPESDELEVLIRAALAAVPEYNCYNVSVNKVNRTTEVPIEDEFGHGYD